MTDREEIEKLLVGSIQDTKAFKSTVFWGNPNFLIVSKYDFDQALALIRKPKMITSFGAGARIPNAAVGKPVPANKPTCKTCGGSGKIPKGTFIETHRQGDLKGPGEPCPDYKPKEPVNE